MDILAAVEPDPLDETEKAQLKVLVEELTMPFPETSTREAGKHVVMVFGIGRSYVLPVQSILIILQPIICRSAGLIG